jgi:hypothetical protein
MSKIILHCQYILNLLFDGQDFIKKVYPKRKDRRKTQTIHKEPKN